MNLLFFPKETDSRESRVPLTPESARWLRGEGLELLMERGLGLGAGFEDAAYEAAGASLLDDPSLGYARADAILAITSPPIEQLAHCRAGTWLMGFLDPFRQTGHIQPLATAGLSALSMEMLPRSTLAQSMDALSSQSSIAGYAAVILAARELGRLFPMMMTPSGTIQPARCLILGAGVAGLQAIATAKRLGARVEACDTRAAAAEQVRSLGARFLSLAPEDTGVTPQGYARELSPEQLAAQRQALAKACSKADIVITAARVFGRQAPLLVDEATLAGMKPGSLLIDLAVETGGNVAGSVADQEIKTARGVRILAPRKAETLFPADASRMLANNVGHLILHTRKHLREQPDNPTGDPILAASLLTHGGRIIHPAFSSPTNPKP